MTLRVATYNVASPSAEKIPLLADVISATQAQIITLNEADDQTVIAALAQRLGMYHIWARGSGDRHVATLSRFPITAWRIYNRKPLTQAALLTTLATPTPLTIFNVHFRPDPYWHFEAIRYLAANALLSVARPYRDKPHLLMGDFNTYAKGDSVDVQTMLRYMRPSDQQILARQRYRFLRLSLPRLLRAGYIDCYRTCQPNSRGFTMTRHGHPVSRLDYILANPNIAPRLTHCTIWDADGVLAVSDHYPVIAEFAL